VDGSVIAYCARCSREPMQAIDDRRQPHPFRYPEHGATCSLDDPVRWARRESDPWDGLM